MIASLCCVPAARSPAPSAHPSSFPACYSSYPQSVGWHWWSLSQEQGHCFLLLLLLQQQHLPVNQQIRMSEAKQAIAKSKKYCKNLCRLKEICTLLFSGCRCLQSTEHARQNRGRGWLTREQSSKKVMLCWYILRWTMMSTSQRLVCEHFRSLLSSTKLTAEWNSSSSPNDRLSKSRRQ